MLGIVGHDLFQYCVRVLAPRISYCGGKLVEFLRQSMMAESCDTLLTREIFFLLGFKYGLVMFKPFFVTCVRSSSFLKLLSLFLARIFSTMNLLV